MADQPVLFCRCANTDIIPDKVKSKVYDALVDAGIAFEETADLCGLSVDNPSLLQKLSEKENLKIVACFGRTVRWLFHAGGATFPNDAEVLNMREEQAEQIIQNLVNTAQKGAKQQLSCKDDWIPWFPIIDYDRCQGCGQCKDFCLFKVFETDEDDEVLVKNPKNCKNRCPACARLCPEAAIIFPKYESAPINGSDEIPAQHEQVSQVDLKSLLQGDLYEMLKSRKPNQDGETAPCLEDEALKSLFRCKCNQKNDGGESPSE